jgi:hypothetical protein
MALLRIVFWSFITKVICPFHDELVVEDLLFQSETSPDSQALSENEVSAASPPVSLPEEQSMVASGSAGPIYDDRFILLTAMF